MLKLPCITALDCSGCVLSRAPGRIPSRLGPSFIRAALHLSPTLHAALWVSAALTRDLRYCLFAPSAVSVVHVCRRAAFCVLCGSLLCLLCCVTVRRWCCVQACGLSWNQARSWRAPLHCANRWRATDTASLHHMSLCRRCMVAAGICTASGTGGNSLSAAPRPAVLGQHHLPVQHFCPSLPCAGREGAPSLGPALQLPLHSACALCYFNLSFRATEVSAGIFLQDSVGRPQMSHLFASRLASLQVSSGSHCTLP